MILAAFREKTFAGKRIAFLGGAFDPPHPGHEMLARSVLALGVSDLVLWVPSWAPPHKITQTGIQHPASQHFVARVRRVKRTAQKGDALLFVTIQLSVSPVR